MGNDINTGFINSTKKWADNVYGNNDGFLDNNDSKEAIDFFKQKVQEAKDNYRINDATFNEAMGLYVTSPIDNNAPETISAYSEKEAYKIAKDGVNDLVNGKNKLQISYELKDGVTLDNIVEKLGAHFVNLKDYDAYSEMNELVEKINNAELTNKDDVKKLKKDLKNDGLTKFQKDVLDDFIKLAEQQVIIDKEYAQLLKYYENIKDGRTDGLNFSNMRNQVEEHFKNKNFYKASWEMFYEHVENDARNYINTERSKDISEGSKSNTKQDVKNDIINETQKGDKIARRQVKNDDNGNTIQARIQKRDRRREALTNISLSDIKYGLDNETYNLLVRTGYLEKCLDNGNYNLSAISDAISAGVGADVLMNDHSDSKLNEMDEVKENLRKLISEANFDNNSTVHDLREFCHIDKDTRDRNIINLDGADAAIAGAVAAVDRPLAINASNITNLDLDLDLLGNGADVDKITSFFTNQGATVTQTNNILSINVENINSIILRQDFIEILAGAGIGLATSLALQLIIGSKKDEKSCWDLSNFNPVKNNYKTFEEFKSFVKQNEPTIANAVIAWATPYFKEDSKNWNTNFYNDLLKIAGNEILNCDEIRAALMSKPVDFEPNSRKAAIETKTTNDEISDCITYKRKANDTWASIVETYYPDLVIKYGLYGANGAIRKLKIALATENGERNEVTYQKLLKATDLPKEICLPQIIDGISVKSDASVPEQAKIAKENMATGEAYHAPLESVGTASVIKVGATTYIARDCQDSTKTASGSSKQEALNNLKKITKVEKYDNEEELLK